MEGVGETDSRRARKECCEHSMQKQPDDLAYSYAFRRHNCHTHIQIHTASAHIFIYAYRCMANGERVAEGMIETQRQKVLMLIRHLFR